MFPPLDAHAERLLVDQCLSHVECAWTEMVARYDRILRYVLSQALDFGQRDPGRVDDLLQDLWLALMNDDCRQLRKFDECRGSLKVFLILQAREHARRLRRQPHVVIYRGTVPIFPATSFRSHRGSSSRSFTSPFRPDKKITVMTDWRAIYRRQEASYFLPRRA